MQPASHMTPTTQLSEIVVQHAETSWETLADVVFIKIVVNNYITTGSVLIGTVLLWKQILYSSMKEYMTYWHRYHAGVV